MQYISIFLYYSTSFFFLYLNKSDWISKSFKHYDVSMNNNIQIFISRLIEFFNIFDWSIYYWSYSLNLNLDFDEYNSLIYLTIHIWNENVIDFGYFTNSTNNFDIRKSESYKKITVFNQAND